VFDEATETRATSKNEYCVLTKRKTQNDERTRKLEFVHFYS
jgi:hypothetical protein